jgi:adenosylhomocysteine nucleosidase
MLVGVVAALKEEIGPLVKRLEDIERSKWGRRTAYQGRMGDCQVMAVAGGVGKVEAAACTQFLIDRFNVKALICMGVAGAVNPDLEKGDIVISKETQQHDYDPGDPRFLKKFRARWLKADAGLVKLALDAARESDLGDHCVLGRVVTGDQAIVSREKREWLWETFGAGCVDMESAAVAEVCRMNGVPWVIVRAISDSAGEDSIAEFRENLAQAANVAASLTTTMVERIRRA